MRVVVAQVDAVCQVRMEGEETDEGAVEVGEVPWGPAAEGPVTGGEGFGIYGGPCAARKGDEMRLGFFLCTRWHSFWGGGIQSVGPTNQL